MAQKGQLEFSFIDAFEGHRSALSDMFARNTRYRRSQTYYELMRFIGRFTKYSPYNCMLLHIQNPAAAYVATPAQWQKRFKRTLKPEARPLLILAPNGPVLFVYDLADTEGEEMAESWKNPLDERIGITQKSWSLTIENSRQDGIFIDSGSNYGLPHAGTAFRLRSSSRVLKEVVDEPFDFLVRIDAEQDLAAQYAALVHELGHIYSGHFGYRAGDWWKNRSRSSYQQVEIEAESISFLVCSRMGIETQSAEYLARFAGQDIEIPAISLETILSVVNHIERMGERLPGK